MIGRIIGVYGPRIEILAEGESIEAIVSGKVKYAGSGESPVAVGDYVEFSRKAENLASIDRILKRKAVISRPAVEKDGLLQIIVSNVDRLIIVGSIAEPALKPGLIDRFLIMAFKEGIIPVIVINKIDLAEPALVNEQIEAWKKISRLVIYTSAVTGYGIDKLSETLANGTSVIAGHSGVGKSSLLNRINPALNIRTGQISRYSGAGTHTTSRVNMFRLFADGWVVDTPGLKDFGLAGVTRRDLHLYFPEFTPYEPACRFGNCVHINEPGCAVKSIIEKADSPIAPIRYYSYTKIYKTLKI